MGVASLPRGLWPLVAFFEMVRDDVLLVILWRNNSFLEEISRRSFDSLVPYTTHKVAWTNLAKSGCTAHVAKIFVSPPPKKVLTPVKQNALKSWLYLSWVAHTTTEKIFPDDVFCYVTCVGVCSLSLSRVLGASCHILDNVRRDCVTHAERELVIIQPPSLFCVRPKVLARLNWWWK